MLRKYNLEPSHVLDVQELDIHKDVSYVERPIKIIDSEKKVLRNRAIHEMSVSHPELFV